MLIQILLVVLLLYTKILEIYIFYDHKKYTNNAVNDFANRIDRLEVAVGNLDSRHTNIEEGLKSVTAINNGKKNGAVGFKNES